MDDIRLFCYKMTHDTGFAPNPFYGFLTLATCKSDIRRCKKDKDKNLRKDDWIAGFSCISGEYKNHPRNIGEEKLIYLAKIDKKIFFKEYWEKSEYECKKRKKGSNDIERLGDNIYKFIGKEKKKEGDTLNNGFYFRDYLGLNHGIEKDLRGENVLISKEFYYFGENAIPVPKPHTYLLESRDRYGKQLNKEVLNKLLGYVIHYIADKKLMLIKEISPKNGKGFVYGYPNKFTNYETDIKCRISKEKIIKCK